MNFLVHELPNRKFLKYIISSSFIEHLSKYTKDTQDSILEIIIVLK